MWLLGLGQAAGACGAIRQCKDDTRITLEIELASPEPQSWHSTAVHQLLTVECKRAPCTDLETSSGCCTLCSSPDAARTASLRLVEQQSAWSPVLAFVRRSCTPGLLLQASARALCPAPRWSIPCTARSFGAYACCRHHLLQLGGRVHESSERADVLECCPWGQPAPSMLHIPCDCRGAAWQIGF